MYGPSQSVCGDITSNFTRMSIAGTLMTIMGKRRRKRRYTATPSRSEVNIPAIPFLSPTGWRCSSLEDVPLVGTVPKNCLSYGDPKKPGVLSYIAKKGRTQNDARECITEEIISKIGNLLPLEMAQSKLVRISKDDVRFLSRNFVVRGQNELFHGVELAAQYFETNPEDVVSAFDLNDRNSEYGFYTLPNILTILKSLYPCEYSCLRDGMFKMLAFDAFVGAPDRHAMNWGVLASPHEEGTPVRFAPIFDTARGLFREISDEDLHLKEMRVGREEYLKGYADRSRPIIGSGQSVRANHFDLVRWIFENHSESHKAMRSVFDNVDVCSIEHMMQISFRRKITQYRIRFIVDLLALRIDTIRKEILQC